ncbi:hypothetical protein J2129_001105 [Methanofollis sp. W23]|uniref:hypothetical protein n=1 Tax=Methanofollis sp. W23 TaxID=2817849 RepID=UPI001AE94E38|nr:hypothetical protein [Methanofollis sp. W23]MBP2145651.1 hypothetical protein [Methanofollis sp. W23]
MTPAPVLSPRTRRGRTLVYAEAFGPGVGVRDFTAFSLRYYAVLVDQATDQGIGEVTVDRYTGEAGMDPGTARYDLPAAETIAETFLDGFLPGATLQENRTFPGYYTFKYGRDEREGMLSVNDRTGQVWVHTWHGHSLGAGDD